MTQEEMHKRIQQLDNDIQKRKTKRNVKLFLGIALVIFLMCIYWFEESILDSLLISLVYSGLYFLSGIIIWTPFMHANDQENKQLEDMKKKYEEKFNSAWY